jgi:mRNA interferase RelE/StbE
MRLPCFVTQLATTNNPRRNGKFMQGEYAAYYRYRVGNYRLICYIDDGNLLINLIKLGYRREIYKK